MVLVFYHWLVALLNDSKYFAIRVYVIDFCLVILVTMIPSSTYYLTITSQNVI